MNWNDTVATMLVGVDRRPGVSEPKLLRSVAVESTRRRAGAVVARIDFSLETAPAESLPECSARATQLLELVLADHFGKGSRTSLLRMWVEQCRAAGRIVPARHAAAILDLGSNDRRVRGAVLDVVGERGRWTAGLLTRWSWVRAGPSEEIDAPIDVIAERLRAVRAADPPQGRDSVVEAARGLAAADRAVLYATLAVGLGPSDEPLLESLLDERSSRIREAAASLLSRLPGSAFVGRMISRLEPLVEKRRLMNRFNVELPEQLDDAAGRDGIVEKAPGGLGQHAWWLRQIVAGVPLAWWEQHLGQDAVSLAAKSPMPDVRIGWIEATRRQGDARWAAALFDAEPAADLLPLLSDTARDTRLAAACSGREPFRTRPPYTELAQMLGHAAVPWSPELSIAVADLFVGTSEDLKGASGLAGMLHQAHPVVVDRLAGSIHRLPDYWQRHVRDAISQITFRRSVEEEFS